MTDVVKLKKEIKNWRDMDLDNIKPISMKHKSPKWMWFLFGILVIVLAGIIVYGRQSGVGLTDVKEILRNAPVSISNAEVVVPKTTTVDTTADWKTYSNDQYGYSIKYPKDWSIDTTSASGISLNSPANQEVEQDIEAGKIYGEGYQKDIYLRYYATIADADGSSTKTWKTLNDWLNDELEFTKGATKITFAGQTAYEGVAGGISAYYHILIPYNNHFYDIYFGTVDEKEKLTSIEEQILSTFQFSTASAATASWKTYANNTYKFTLQFPDSWEGYTTKERKTGDNSLTTIYFSLPTTDKNWPASSDSAAGSASLFAMTIYTPAGWAQEQADASADGAEVGRPIKETVNYVYLWTGAQAYPSDLISVAKPSTDSIFASFDTTN